MANVKITDLGAYTNPASTDVLPIVDVGADVTKKVSIADLLKNASAGTAAAPGIAFDGDNTGIYSPGADQLALSTNGTGRLFVDASGNVSIGLSSSTTALNVAKTSSGADSNTLLVQNRADAIGTTASIYFSTNTAGTGIERSAAIKGISGSGTATELALFTNAIGDIPAERLRITSTGLVGIGTSSPGSLLSLYAGASAEYFRGGGNGVTTRDLVFSASTGTNAGDTHTINASGSSGRLILSTASSPRMTVDFQGRVGIGTTSPSQELSIEDNGDTYALIKRTTSGSESAILVGAESGKTVIYSRDNATGGRNLEFAIGTSPAARIDSSGRLLVGTSSDSGGALLQVNGDRIRVATAKTPASASDTGTAGEICWDASYIYVCTATNTWKRAALSTW